MSSLDEIKALLEDSSQSTYNAANIPELEQFVALQLAGTAPYYFQANRVLAKLYTFYPEQSNNDVIAQMLLLSMLEFPSTDILALECLVPNQTGEPIATIIRCANSLDSCRFSDFWKDYKTLEGDATLGNLVKTSQERLCKAIAGVLQLSYKSAPLALVQASLNESNVEKFVEKVDGDVVYFAPTAENTKRDRVFQEGVTFGEISTLVRKTTTVAKE